MDKLEIDFSDDSKDNPNIASPNSPEPVDVFYPEAKLNNQRPHNPSHNEVPISPMCASVDTNEWDESPTPNKCESSFFYKKTSINPVCHDDKEISDQLNNSFTVTDPVLKDNKTSSCGNT